MAQRRKSLTESEVRTVLAVIECFQEQNHYRFDNMNTVMGNLTIEDMMKLQGKLKKWLPEEPEYEWGEPETDDYEEDYCESESDWQFYHDSLLRY